MKRSSSDIDRPSSASVSSHQLDDFKPELTPPPPETRAKKATPKKKAKMEGSGSSHEGGGGGNGEWTPEKKAVFMDRVIAAGYKVLDLNTLAIEVSTGLAWWA
jgi:hypothetical protein